MSLVQRFLSWLDPVPPEHRDLAPAFDLETRTGLWNLIVPFNILGSVALVGLGVQDYFLYGDVVGPLMLLRVCLIAELLVFAAIGRWRRGRGSVYHLVVWNYVGIACIAGLMLMVHRDPIGPYWIFVYTLIVLASVLPWPTTWVIRANLAIIVIYLITALLAGALGQVVLFLIHDFYLVTGMLVFAAVNKLLADLRWNNFFHQRQVQVLNDLLQEKLDVQARLYTQLGEEKKRSDDLLNVVIPIGVALSAEQDFDQLLQRIVLEAKTFCNADAGTLYLRTEDDCLEFVVVHNDSLNIAAGEALGQEISLPALHLYDEATGEPNHHNVATHAALCGESVNVPDAYQAEAFDFSGTRDFDARTGYRSISFLTIPLKNSLGHVIGVLQLINAQDPETGQVIPFDEGLQQLVESISLLAVVALEAYIREQSLRQEIQQLRIELDEARRKRQVAEITETDYFRQLRARARELRRGTD